MEESSPRIEARAPSEGPVGPNHSEPAPAPVEGGDGEVALVGAEDASAQHLAAQLLDDTDGTFLHAMREAGLLTELQSAELLRIASEAEESDEEARHVELLLLYYQASGDQVRAGARRRADRFFCQVSGEPTTAELLVARFADVAPEVPAIRLERIGGDEGPLVLRAGEHFAAVMEADEEDADEPVDDEVPMVTVRGLVRALNVLMDRHGVRQRLVALRGDARHEIYVGVGVSEAMQLAQAGYLEDLNPELVMELGAW